MNNEERKMVIKVLEGLRDDKAIPMTRKKLNHFLNLAIFELEQMKGEEE